MTTTSFSRNEAAKAKTKIMKLLETHKASPEKSAKPICWNVGDNQISLREYTNAKGLTSKISLKFNGVELTKAFSETAIDEALASVIEEPEEVPEEQTEVALEQAPPVESEETRLAKEWAQSVIDTIEPLYNDEADFTLQTFEYGPFCIMFERLTCSCGQAKMQVTAKKDKFSTELQETDRNVLGCDMEIVRLIFNQAFEIVLPETASSSRQPRISQSCPRKRPLGQPTGEPSTVDHCAILSIINNHLDAQGSGITVKASTAATDWYNAEFNSRLQQGRTPREISLELDGEYGAKLKEIEDDIRSADEDLITARDGLVDAINAAHAAFNRNKAARTTRN